MYQRSWMFFWQVKKWNVILTELGLYTDRYLSSLWENRWTIDIHEYIVMPNHIHVLIIINDYWPSQNKSIINTRQCRDVLLGRPQIQNMNDGMWNVDINNNRQAIGNEQNVATSGHAKSVSLQTLYNAEYQWPNLGSIINMFKGAITKFTRKNEIRFKRQPRYHDHIIRNDDEYFRIKYYIKNNPMKWKEDKFNS